jgi:transcriptional regulator with XRE-family HTH domain
MPGRLRKQFGSRLKGMRLDRKLTQEQFAELLGMSVDFLSLIERGVNAPSFETLEQMSDRLGVPVATFFTFGKQISSVR